MTYQIFREAAGPSRNGAGRPGRTGPGRTGGGRDGRVAPTRRVQWLGAVALLVLWVLLLSGCASLGGGAAGSDADADAEAADDGRVAWAQTLDALPEDIGTLPDHEGNLLQFRGLRVAFPASRKAFGPEDPISEGAFLILDDTNSDKRTRIDHLVFEVDVDPERMASVVEGELDLGRYGADEGFVSADRTLNGKPFELLRFGMGAVALFCDGPEVWIIEERARLGFFSPEDFEEFVTVLASLSFDAPPRSLRDSFETALFVGLEGWRWTGDTPEGYNLLRTAAAWPAEAQLLVEPSRRPPVELEGAVPLPPSVRYERGMVGRAEDGRWTIVRETGTRRLMITFEGDGPVRSGAELVELAPVVALLQGCVVSPEVER